MLIAYARTSTLDQAGPNKTSIGEQLDKCKAIAQIRSSAGKYDYQAFTDKGVSGSIPLHKRPGGKELLDAAKKGDCIVAAKMDRIFRSGADALATIERFKKEKIGLILCDLGIEPVAESPVATVIFSVFAAFAQFERERIHERITVGKLGKKARGGHIGGPTPIGYRKIGTGPKSILVRDEAEVEHLRRMRYHASEDNPSCARIAARLAGEGILGRDGKPYNRMTVWRMLHGEAAKRANVPGNPDRGEMENVFEAAT